MKSWEKRNSPVWINLDRKKWTRKRRLSKKSTFSGKQKDHHYGFKVVAPTFIDVYKVKYTEPFLEFLDELLRLSIIYAQNNHKLTICFRNTIFISASAALLLLSRVETIKINNPNLNLSLTRPPKWLPRKGKFHTPQLSTVGPVLNPLCQTTCRA